MTAFPILQFGTSRFLQAHVDLFVSEALAQGEATGRIAVVQTTSSKESRKRLAVFAAGKPYLVKVKGLAGGKIIDESVEVTSVGAGLDAATQWDEVERLFNAARCAVSNTADRGYETDPADRLTKSRRCRSQPSSPSCCSRVIAPAPSRSRFFRAN